MAQFSLRSSRLLFFVSALCAISTLAILFDLANSRHTVSYFSSWTLDPNSAQWAEMSDGAVGRRLNAVRKSCTKSDPYEKAFGRANLRMTRAYEGSLFRLERFINKVIRGEPVVIGLLGGSITAGHGVEKEERWGDQLQNIMNDAYPGANITIVNGAIPASGSDYFSFCFSLHIPVEADLVIVELAVNDEAITEHFNDMDNLLRGLLQLPNEPAVMLYELAAFSNGQMAGGGGRMHLSIAQYYDVPVLNQRWPLVNHFARFPQLVSHFFVNDENGVDLRHLGRKGHHDAGQIVGSFLRDATCNMVQAPDYHVPLATTVSKPFLPVENTPESSYEQQLETIFNGKPDSSNVINTVHDIQAGWPSETKQWVYEPEGDDGKHVAPGMWTQPTELGMLPRLMAMDNWNSDVNHVTPPFRPFCLSTRAHEPKFNLTPIESDGWFYWVIDWIPDKPYLVAERPGAKVTFEIEVNVGVIKIYSLRSKTYGLGMIKCWIDDNVKDAVKVDGYWDNENLNIGRFSTIGENLSPGKHRLTCELLAETNDPEGRVFFRLISAMGV